MIRFIVGQRLIFTNGAEVTVGPAYDISCFLYDLSINGPIVNLTMSNRNLEGGQLELERRKQNDH